MRQTAVVTLARVLLFFFQAEDGIRDLTVTGVQTCALPISPVAEGERAIVVAAAGPESHALGVKAHQRQEHHVQPARAEALPRLRLGDPQAIALERAAHLDELHGARGAPPVDARQVDAAAAAARQRDERRGIELFGERRIDGDAPARAQVHLAVDVARYAERSEEHTSELQSQSNLVCRLLLEKKKK